VDHAADEDRVLQIGPWAIPHRLLAFDFTRSRGPGGQNVNKLNTRAVMTVRLDDVAAILPLPIVDRLALLAAPYLTADRRLILTCEDHRSQHANRLECLDKLRVLLLRAAVRPKVRRATRPSRGSRERRLESKKHRGEIKRRRGDWGD
jgi:ribosome-associated protein